MKKGLYLVLIIMLVIVTGCNKEKAKTMTCTRVVEDSQGNKFNYNYKITYRGKYVEEVDATEKLESGDIRFLEAAKSSAEEKYNNYKNIKHHEHSISIEKGILTVHAYFDYTKIDTDKLIEIDIADSKYIKDGKVVLENLKKVYETEGQFTCK